MTIIREKENRWRVLKLVIPCGAEMRAYEEMHPAVHSVDLDRVVHVLKKE